MHKIKARYQGFVPQFYPHTTKLCAYYHCKKERDIGRRYCVEHAKQYDFEALEGQERILVFPASC